MSKIVITLIDSIDGQDVSVAFDPPLEKIRAHAKHHPKESTAADLYAMAAAQTILTLAMKQTDRPLIYRPR